MKVEKTWVENGIEYGYCKCGNLCNTGPDPCYGLDFCGDCACVTCEQCRLHEQHTHIVLPGELRYVKC